MRNTLELKQQISFRLSDLDHRLRRNSTPTPTQSSAAGKLATKARDLVGEVKVK